MFIIEYKKNLTTSYLRIKFKFFFIFIKAWSQMNINMWQKMSLNVSMGGLWGDFTIIFWITKYV